jgi:multidrug resistance efflux pump
VRQEEFGNEVTLSLVIAASERKRQEALCQFGLISRRDRERAEHDYQVAQAGLDQAREHSSLVSAPARPDELARAHAELDLARAQLDEAQAILEKTIVRAPFDGTVMRKVRRPGEAVSDRADTPIVSFGDNSRLRVRVDVDETDVGKVRVGGRAYFTAAAFGTQQFWGRVIQIGQELGKKNIETDQPTRKDDTKVLETLVELDGLPPLPTGLRVDSFLLVKE